MEGLYVKGVSKFETEVEYGLRVPMEKRFLVKAKNKDVEERVAMFEDGTNEEVIASHFDSRVLY
jgi:hypothetical protein